MVAHPGAEVDLDGVEDAEVGELRVELIGMHLHLLQRGGSAHVVQEWQDGLQARASQALDGDGFCNMAWLVLDCLKYIQPLLRCWLIRDCGFFVDGFVCGWVEICHRGSV